MEIAALIQSALAFHKAGDMPRAEALYREALATEPEHPDALHLLGILVDQTGRPDKAIELLTLAATLRPGAAHFHISLAAALTHAGRLAQAIDALQRARELDRKNPAILSNLGNVFRQQSRFAEAQSAYRAAIALEPTFADAHFNLALILLHERRLDEAFASFLAVTRIDPATYDAWHEAGAILEFQQKWEAAVALYRQAFAAHATRAAAEPDLQRAEQNIRSRGVHPAAPATSGPQTSDQLLARAKRLAAEGAPGDALELAREVIAENPTLAEPWHLLATLLTEAGKLDAADDACEVALQLAPNDPESHRTLGKVRKDQGRMADAIAAFGTALSLAPHSASLHSALLQSLHYLPGISAQRMLEEHQEFDRRHAVPLRDLRPHANSRVPDRKLRIGYVSGDFSIHVVGQNMLPLFESHDAGRFEIYCYSNSARADSVTSRFKSAAFGWRDISTMPDGPVAELIRADQIDILVDLALHTRLNRLLVFARKPAPVQVTFAGYPGTTGLSAIDYRITDSFLDPPAAESLPYAERSVRIRSFWCYAPLPDDPAEAPTANTGLSATGVVTFGCLNNFCKINQATLALWSRVLHAVKGSRLILLSSEGTHSQRTRAYVETLGIDAARITFLPRQTRAGYLGFHNQIDICLDTLPYNGHTTTLDALWMGVPVLTLPGDTVVGRAGVSQLNNLGLPELIAGSADEFVRLAVALAQNPALLGTQRRTLRERMRASPLTDARSFARGIESAYSTMWRHWCEHRA